MPGIVLNIFCRTSYVILAILEDRSCTHFAEDKTGRERLSVLSKSIQLVSFGVGVRTQSYRHPNQELALFLDAGVASVQTSSGLAGDPLESRAKAKWLTWTPKELPPATRPTTRGMALSSGQALSRARTRTRRAAEGWARSCRGSRGRADGTGGGQPFGVRSTFLRAYVASRRRVVGTTSNPLRGAVASPWS